MKCRSRMLAVCNSECILVAPASAQNIIVRPQIHWQSAVTRLTTSCGVYFASESIVPRSQTLTNWNDASTANGSLCLTRSLNVLSASGVSVYALAFVLEADILAHAVIKMMWCDTCDFSETVTASRVCHYSVNHSSVHLINALTVQSDTSNFL